MKELRPGASEKAEISDAFSKILGELPQNLDKKTIILKAAWIDTLLGPLLAIADDKVLCLLEFVAGRGLKREMEQLRRLGFVIIPGNAAPLTSIKAELNAYFEGKLTQFKTPYHLFGTTFQQQVWQALCQIPYGETRSYAEQACSLEKPSAYRAVANANGANQLVIIIPCHRVISSDGTIGGYDGGLPAKRWLLEHEKQHKTSLF